MLEDKKELDKSVEKVDCRLIFCEIVKGILEAFLYFLILIIRKPVSVGISCALFCVCYKIGAFSMLYHDILQMLYNIFH